MLLLFPLFGGCTATVLRGLTYSKILCTPKKMKESEKSSLLLLLMCLLSPDRADFHSGYLLCVFVFLSVSVIKVLVHVKDLES